MIQFFGNFLIKNIPQSTQNKNKQYRQRMYNVTLRNVHASTVALGKK
jgi:hypothetical protein